MKKQSKRKKTAKSQRKITKRSKKKKLQSKRKSIKGTIKSRRDFISGAVGATIVAFYLALQEKMGKKAADATIKGITNVVKSVPEHILDSNYTFYPVKRKIADALHVMNESKAKLKILGINALGPLHQGLEEIKRILDGGGDVKVLLLDARHDIFRAREQQECARQKDGLSSSRLTKEWDASIEILRDLYLRKKKGKLEVRVHQKYPECALVIGDDKKLQYNRYPTDKKQDSSDSELPRGVSGETFLYDITEYPIEVTSLITYFDKLWDLFKEDKYRILSS